jgi:hypothetical protein
MFHLTLEQAELLEQKLVKEMDGQWKFYTYCENQPGVASIVPAQIRIKMLVEMDTMNSILGNLREHIQTLSPGTKPACTTPATSV